MYLKKDNTYLDFFYLQLRVEKCLYLRLAPRGYGLDRLKHSLHKGND